jgi:hypothetical protein
LGYIARPCLKNKKRQRRRKKEHIPYVFGKNVPSAIVGFNILHIPIG